MNVTRIFEGGNSHIEPPLEQSWSDLKKLQWQAAVVAEDTGIEHVAVTRARYSIGSIFQRGYYNVQAGYFNSIGPLNFDQAWSFLNGVSRGVQYTREPR